MKTRPLTNKINQHQVKRYKGQLGGTRPTRNWPGTKRKSKPSGYRNWSDQINHASVKASLPTPHTHTHPPPPLPPPLHAKNWAIALRYRLVISSSHSVIYLISLLKLFFFIFSFLFCASLITWLEKFFFFVWLISSAPLEFLFGFYRHHLLLLLVLLVLLFLLLLLLVFHFLSRLVFNWLFNWELDRCVTSLLKLFKVALIKRKGFNDWLTFHCSCNEQVTVSWLLC